MKIFLSIVSSYVLTNIILLFIVFISPYLPNFIGAPLIDFLEHLYSWGINYEEIIILSIIFLSIWFLIYKKIRKNMDKVKLNILKFINKYWNLEITDFLFNKNYREVLIPFLITIVISLCFWIFLLTGKLYILIEPYLILIFNYEFHITMRIYQFYEDHFIYGTLIFLLFFVVNVFALYFIWFNIIFLFIVCNAYLLFFEITMLRTIRFANFLTFGAFDPDIENYKDHLS